jgi:phage terminase small subunit
MPLTDKQRRFVEEYAGSAKFNGSEAARRAGYTGNENTITTMASKLLANKEISEAIQARMDKLAAKCDISAEKVLRELALLGFSNMRDYMQITSDGDPYISLSDLTREQAAAISELTVEDYKEGRGEDARDVKRIKIKVSDKRGALELLGKHLGIFKNDGQVNVNLSLEPKIYLPDNGRD